MQIFTWMRFLQFVKPLSEKAAAANSSDIHILKKYESTVRAVRIPDNSLLYVLLIEHWRNIFMRANGKRCFSIP